MTVVRPQNTSAGFESLYRDNRADIYAYVAGLLRDRAAAEDVTALAFERAFKRWSTYDAGRGTPRAWLFGIARNAALDELRKRKRQAPLAFDPATEDLDLTAGEDEVERALRREALRAAMATLTVCERELITLKFHAGLANGEIARVLGTSESNAGTLVHRAMQKLRRAVHVPA
jgi:RNA polymerase sigma-70 factor (ECF subfamily)